MSASTDGFYEEDEPPANVERAFAEGRHAVTRPRGGARFEIYTEETGQFRFRLKAANGDIVATGEAYPTREAAMRGVEAVKGAVRTAELVVQPLAT